MRLRELAVKQTAPDERAKKLFDGGGLYLLITPTGNRYWRYRYRYHGRDKTICLGIYPQMSLKEARKAHREAKALLDVGKDPVTEKRARKGRKYRYSENTFESLAREWHEICAPNYRNAKHRAQVINTLTTYVFPAIGMLPIETISPLALNAVLREIRDKPETCSRVRQRISAVYDYAIQTGRMTWNPVPALPNPGRGKTVRHHPALPANEIAKFFEDLEHYGQRQTALALRFLMLTFVRVGELRQGEWSEIHGNEWHIPETKMKMRRAHIVPLSDWALETLEELRAYSGQSRLFVPSPLNESMPISDTTLSKAMIVMGYRDKAVPHGFRALASSVLNESGLFNPDAIERQLAHKEMNKVRAAYNRAEYLEERHRMMQWWSDYLKKRSP